LNNKTGTTFKSRGFLCERSDCERLRQHPNLVFSHRSRRIKPDQAITKAVDFNHKKKLLIYPHFPLLSVAKESFFALSAF
jgi:hypothetical protein